MPAQRPYPTDPWQDHPGLCNARKTNGTGLCRHEAGWGTDHPGDGQCKKHGGSTPSGKSAAAKARETRILGPLLEQYRDQIGDHPDPFEGMLEVVRNGWAWMRMLEERIGALSDDTGELYLPDHQDNDRPHVLVGMLVQARREHRYNCAEAIRAGIAERMVALAEDQADRIAHMLRGLVSELGHELEDPEVADVVRRHLRLLPGTGDAA
jgi:hypothetical protein